MKVRCVWEHNGNDSILYAENYIGAFTRGESLDAAIQKMRRFIWHDRIHAKAMYRMAVKTFGEDVIPKEIIFVE